MKRSQLYATGESNWSRFNPVMPFLIRRSVKMAARHLHPVPSACGNLTASPPASSPPSWTATLQISLSLLSSTSSFVSPPLTPLPIRWPLLPYRSSTTRQATLLSPVWLVSLKFIVRHIECLDTSGTKYRLFTKLKTQIESNLRDESFEPN